ncbi:hypothetical protein ABBQ32_006921 [Trebouxia sp. C0010 RCD-2024]
MRTGTGTESVTPEVTGLLWTWDNCQTLPPGDLTVNFILESQRQQHGQEYHSSLCQVQQCKKQWNGWPLSWSGIIPLG